MNNKELFFCEQCKKEIWAEKNKNYQNEKICDNGCSNNFLIYLGQTQEEISARKKIFLEKKQLNIPINESIEDDFEEYARTNHSSNKKSDDFIFH